MMKQADRIAVRTQLKDWHDDIRYAILEEDAQINVSAADLQRLAIINDAIDTLANDYERLHDKIVYAIHRRMDSVGKEQAGSDIVVQTLRDILKSEHVS